MRVLLINAALMIMRRLMDKRIIDALSKLVLGQLTAPIPGSEKRTQVLASLHEVYTDLQPAIREAGSALISAALELLVAQLKARLS